MALPRSPHGARALPTAHVLWVPAACILWILTGDWVAALAIALLGAAWWLLRDREGPPVLALAFTFQWLQVTIGLFYVSLTGREIETSLQSDYRPMVILGLVSLTVLLLGVTLTWRSLSRARQSTPRDTVLALSTMQLGVGYAGTVVLHGSLSVLAWNVPQLTQGLLALAFVRFAVLYLLLRRLALPRLQPLPFAAVLLFDVALGVTGFFAGFREPLIIGVLVLLEGGRRMRAGRRIAIAALGALMVAIGVLWTAVKPEYRKALNSGAIERKTEKLALLGSLASRAVQGGPAEFGNTLDAFVDRIWQVYYPALALARVPTVIAHTDGAFVRDAVLRVVTPRLLFPDKAALTSDSDKVRRYAGVWVAGAEEGTSMAFGYVAESYVDFGIPGMFVPIFAYGLFVGAACAGLMRAIKHRDLAIATGAVVGWLSLFLFERSWAMTVGTSVTTIVFLGGTLLLIDRLVARPTYRQRVTGSEGGASYGSLSRVRVRPIVVPDEQ